MRNVYYFLIWWWKKYEITFEHVFLASIFLCVSALVIGVFSSKLGAALFLLAIFIFLGSAIIFGIREFIYLPIRKQYNLFKEEQQYILNRLANNSTKK